MDCLDYILRLNEMARLYGLSKEAQIMFLRIWERFAFLDWKPRGIEYPQSQLMFDAKIKTAAKLYRARKELCRCGLIAITKGPRLMYSLTPVPCDERWDRRWGTV